MFRLLIVEDEKLLRESLCVMVDWESAGVEVAGTAENGLRALDFLAGNAVDIVLTDIRMPAMDGLELACEIQSRYPQVRTVLYSAYSEFSFARRGIEYGVSGYLLKSQDEEEIAAYFRELCRKMQRALPPPPSRSQGAGSLWGWRDALFARLAKGEDTAVSSDEELRCKLALREKRLAVLLVQLDGAAELADALGAAGFRQLKKYFAEQGLVELEWQGSGYLMRTGEELAALWTDFDPDWEERLAAFHQTLGGELRAFESSLPVTITASLGRPATGPAGVRESYEDAASGMERRFFAGNGRLFRGGERQPDAGDAPPAEAEVALAEAAVFCRERKTGELFRTLDILREAWGAGESRISQRQVELFGMKWILQLADAAGRRGDSGGGLIEKGGEFVQAVARAETMDGLFEQLRLASQEFAGDGVPFALRQPKKIVAKALDYLREHYAEEVSLEKAAAFVAVHPVHLSRLFRQETGQTFKEALTRLRIEAAKELLADLDLRVYEISERVGYKKPRYFSELFKEMTGMTPLEWREKR